jgi:hypothetical protein
LANSYASNLIAIALTRRLEQDAIALHGDDEVRQLLSLVRLTDLEGLSASAAKHVRKECRRMRILSDLGLWRDAPSLDTPPLHRAMSGPKPTLGFPPSRDPHRPLPDEYVSALGTRTLWVVKELGPNLLVIAARLLAVWTATASQGWAPVTVRDRRRDAVKDALARHSWKASDGQPLGLPPFLLELPIPKGFGRELEPEAEDDEDDEGGDKRDEEAEVRWPPKNYVDFSHLLGTLQAAHLVVALLSVGPRRSEILGLPFDCVVYAADGRPYAEGRTFKLVERHDGEERDWLLPELAVEAIEQQTRLVRLCETVGTLTPNPAVLSNPVSSTLWLRISSNQAQCNPTNSLRDIN